MDEIEMKETGLPWLPYIPERWDLKRNKDFLEEKKDVVGEKYLDYDLLSLTTRGIILRDMDSGKGKFPSDFSKYKIVSEGDIAFCLFDIDETPRTVGLSPYDGMLTGAYSIFKLSGINPRYFYHYYLTLDNIKALKPLYSGLRKTIGSDAFGSIKLPVPPEDEQSKIVAYLDWQESTINKLIKTKRSELSLLNESKHIFIKNTVLGVENKNEKIKTDLPWAPFVPNNWKRYRLKQLLTPCHEKVGDISSEYLLLSLTTQGIIPRDIDSGKGKFPSDFSSYQVVKKGEFVFCLFDIDETPRTVGLSEYDGMITGAYSVFTTDNVDPKYLLYYFMTLDDEKALKPLYTGLRKVISTDVFLGQTIYLPPLEEQNEIVKKIEEFLKVSEKVGEAYQKEIILLKEIRTNIAIQIISGVLDTRNLLIPEFEFIDDEEPSQSDNEFDDNEEV
jgi:Restriction endonuclease S subunits